MPKKLVLKNWNEVGDYLAAAHEKQALSIVSLDVFDTVLARIDTPVQIQRNVCRLVGQLLGDAMGVDEVFLARQLSEKYLREQSYQQGLDHECRFSELAALWCRHLVGEDSPELPELVEKVLDIELQMEGLALYVKADVMPLLEWLQQQAIKTIAISDMYLDGYLLDRLLAQLGIAHYFADVVVSADSRLGKYTGRLFEQVQQEHGIDVSQWVHVGDNPHSDRKMPCELGIQGIWLYEKAELQRIQQQHLNLTMAERGGIWQGRYFFSQVQACLQQDEQYQNNQADAYFRYGCEVLGPAFSSFMLGLQERLQQNPVERIFFIARDGYLFQKMYQQQTDILPNQYIYLSRRVIAAASIADGLTLEQAQVAFYNPKQSGLASICKVYGLNELHLQPLAEQYGFDDMSAPIQDWNDERLIQWLADTQVQALIREAGQQARRDLEGYLTQVGFFDCTHIAWVDIGWNGTLQHFLQKIFGGQAGYPRVQGYYFALVPKLHSDFLEHNEAEGILHDSRRLNDSERIVAEFEEVFEQGARAQHGTTLGYRYQKGRYEPVLKSEQFADRQAEILANPLVEKLQLGIMTHWHYFQLVQLLTAYDSQVLLPYIHGVLERAVVYPSKEEVAILARLVHTEDFGHDHILSLGKRHLEWGDILRPWRYAQRLKTEAWRYATVSQLPTGVANFAMRMVYLHSVKK